MRKRQGRLDKLTADEKAKRRQRNERRARNAERKSDEPRKAPVSALVGPPELGRAGLRSSDSRHRHQQAIINNMNKFRDMPPCDCRGCVAKREREELERALKSRGKARRS